VLLLLLLHDHQLVLQKLLLQLLKLLHRHLQQLLLLLLLLLLLMMVLLPITAIQALLPMVRSLCMAPGARKSQHAVEPAAARPLSGVVGGAGWR
jgi:hypothetical protein